MCAPYFPFRYSSYYLPVGQRLFVSGREGVFTLNPDKAKRPYLFDAKALEVPLNAVNPRDFVQSSEDGRYHVIRLQQGYDDFNMIWNHFSALHHPTLAVGGALLRPMLIGC